jgi:hypothetical protein
MRGHQASINFFKYNWDNNLLGKNKAESTIKSIENKYDSRMDSQFPGNYYNKRLYK